jgi:hypothetical protein
VDLAELLIGEVRVNLRCGNVRVAEEFLHGTNIRAVHQEVGRKIVAKFMGVHRFCDARLARPERDHAFRGPRRDAANDLSGAVDAHEERHLRIGASLQVSTDGILCGW